MKIVIFGNNCQQAWLAELSRFFRDLEKRNFATAVESRFARYLSSQGIPLGHAEIVADPPADAQMLLSVGGDGTFLRAAEWIGPLGLPVMGINTGHLGYLAGFSFDRPDEIFAALGGNYDLTRRITLRVESDRLPAGFHPYALNEVSVAKGDTTSMVSIRAYIDGKFLADYQSDGLLISTPTGSTAYNLSCGGPIVQPTLDCMVLTPVAPHSLTLRPLVIAPDATLELHVSSRGEMCNVGVDGRTFAIPSEGSRLRVSRAPYAVNVVQRPDAGFPEVLRDKLHWAAN